MIQKVEYTWSDIYKEWKYMSHKLPNISKEIIVNKIKVKPWRREGEYFYGLDWILNENFNERTKYVAEHSDMFVTNGVALNKGTLTTLRYLVDAEEKETRAAIWIYAFISDVLDYQLQNWRGDAYRIANAVKNAASSYLYDKEIEWHHAMKKLLPEVCFSTVFLEAININDKYIVLELAAYAVDHILIHYKVAEYDSRE